MRPTLLLDPHFRETKVIFSSDDLARVSSAASVVWGRDEPIPEAELEKLAPDVEIIVTTSGGTETSPGSRSFGRSSRFRVDSPRLRR